MNFKEALIAYLQGEKVEVSYKGGEWKSFAEDFKNTSLYSLNHNNFDRGHTFRITPRTIIVNGVKVPAPEKKIPICGTYYFIPCLDTDNLWCEYLWTGSDLDYQRLDRGLVYLKDGDTIERAKAMLITKEVE